MKKNLIIIILLVFVALSISYALVKSGEAEKEYMATEAVLKEALKQKERADELQQLAEQKRLETVEATSIARDFLAQLEECKSK